MIDIEKAKKAGYAVQNSAEQLPDEKQAKIDAIKAILPNVVNSDGVVDVNALKDLVGAENIASNNQGYTLGFAGKGLARAAADRPTNYELKIELGQSKNFDTTENVIIRGDNIDVLKILQQNCTDKIKMIYIDPPYNTKSDDFIYNDNFRKKEAELIEELGLQEDMVNYLDNVYSTKSHSGWLSFIYPRIKLARELLTDDGVIFISIDDKEQAPLKIICDEIFGEENFVGKFIWRKKEGGGQTKDAFVVEDETVLLYQKSEKFTWQDETIPVDSDSIKKEDDLGKYTTVRLAKWGTAARMQDRPKQYFAIKSPDNKNIYPVAPDGSNGRWRVGQKRMNLLIENNLIEWAYKKNKWIPYEKIYHDDDDIKTIKERSIIYDLCNTADSSKVLSKLFKRKDIFDNSKPYELIQFLILHSTNNDSIILDFFAGSGTTAHAVMQINTENDGNRKFILVQKDEKIDESKAAYDFCTENKLKPVISSICIERVNRAGDKIKQEQEENRQLDLLQENQNADSIFDIGYKVFSLVSRPKLVMGENQQLELDIQRKTTQDKLYNMLSASGKLLSNTITIIEKDRLYHVDDSYYLLNQCETDLTQFSDSAIYVNPYSDIALETWLNLLGIDKENIKLLY